MNNFNFKIPQEIICGQDSILKLPEILKKQQLKKVMIISGPNLNKMGVVKKITDILSCEGIEFVTFVEIEANPSVETVDLATKAFLASEADSIIALGGGSPIDVAKAVGVLAKYGGSITEYEGADKVPGTIIPMIVIPTTAGTGSEVTAFSVITDRKRNYKLTVFSYELIPAYAILDPNLVMTSPVKTAAACGIDALVHAIEAYLSKAASPFSDAMAEKAMELIGKNIRLFVADRQNEKAAENMLYGSMFAGIAFAWARLGNVHAMAHPLGGYFDVPHGVANAILLPVVLEYNALADEGRYEKIYHYIKNNKGTDNFIPEILVAEIRKLTKALGIPENLTTVGVTEDLIPAMAIDAMKSGNIAINPRITTQKDIEELYQRAL
ncbi:iron-containing alcohol dehydrogenase family protein [Acetobacterium woodii]|uniref:1,3-propanediol dehydrogenase DhaT n=1 Tax=Acetobacterium woodii (strain ATCC 29683 / DSM 1030 / JCM 2381 / KCTC 1655 / WB1) TaxID=931626 RepID=H6LHY6_ACEWD|nr:iron-containing alcohol dehydrogenase [Acetobacterium woodii]AFA48516.1 1,3-propanediol dehydrogenase DhaT [Acetobacterium woodii DSM 1030]